VPISRFRPARPRPSNQQTLKKHPSRWTPPALLYPLWRKVFTLLRMVDIGVVCLTGNIVPRADVCTGRVDIKPTGT